jgi:hypothetical protein
MVLLIQGMVVLSQDSWFSSMVRVLGLCVCFPRGISFKILSIAFPFFFGQSSFLFAVFRFFSFH